MKDERYPQLWFRISGGRRLYVHGFFWEPTYAEIIELDAEPEKRPVKVERKKLQVEAVFGNRPVHFIGPEWVDQYVNHPPRIQNTEVSVMLSSSPIAGDALYSELIVVFYVDHHPGTSIEAMLENALADLDWEKHAEDVTEAQNELWKEVWVERIVH